MYTNGSFHGKLKPLRLWVLSTIDIWEGKGITCHKFLNWGKIKTTMYEGHIGCVYTNTHIYTGSYINTYTNNMEYTYTHTLALNSVSYCIIYSPSLEAVFSSFDSGNWWLSSKKT